MICVRREQRIYVTRTETEDIHERKEDDAYYTLK